MMPARRKFLGAVVAASVRAATSSLTAISLLFGLTVQPPSRGGVTINSTATAAAQTRQSAAPNVLFITVDDLRAIGASYGTPQVRTPNMDALAARGTVFNRAYSQQALCSPSRTSLLTGRRPDTTKVYDLRTHFRDRVPEVVTLPQYFKNNGYHAQAVGKIYHNELDDQPSWSAPHWMPKGPNFSSGTEKGRGRPWEASPLGDRELPDGQIADRAIELLRQHKDGKFFLAVGFLKPHLPFIAPQKYFDLYPPDTIRLAPNNTPPAGVPEAALTWGEMRSYEGVPKSGDVPDAQAKELIRAYYAATSYMDTQLGRVLAELDRLGLRDSTIVVLLGDHGFSLGEQGMWTKHSNFETVLRVPLIVSVPGQKKVGAKTDALVELVDAYPTLVEAAKLPLPGGLEGLSLMPLLENPHRPWKKAAFSQFAHLPGRDAGAPTRRLGAPYTVRTKRYRYVEYTTSDDRELYDFQADPLGTVNVARRPEMKAVVAEMSRMLRGGWQAALPADAKNPREAKLK